jgi:hypothetical protein
MDLREEVVQLMEQLRATQERLSTEDHRGSFVQRSLRRVKYELKKMKGARAEPEFRQRLENLKQALGTTDDV